MQTDWEDLKLLLQEAADHAFGRKKVVSNDWFDDQDEEIKKLLKDKKLNINAFRTHQSNEKHVVSEKSLTSRAILTRKEPSRILCHIK